MRETRVPRRCGVPVVLESVEEELAQLLTSVMARPIRLMGAASGGTDVLRGTAGQLTLRIRIRGRDSRGCRSALCCRAP